MNQLVSFSLNGKQTRTVNRCLRELFSGRSLEPMTLQALKEMSFLEHLRRRVKVGTDGREALMSETSVGAYGRVVDVLAEAAANVDTFTKSDVRSAMQDIYDSCWQERRVPEDAAELVSLVCAHIEDRVATRTIAAGLRGVTLKGVKEVKLGRLRLVPSVEAIITEADLTTEDGDPPKGASKKLLEVPCLCGSYVGTQDATKRWYREQAYLTAGMLAVEAGASYERAASTFFIEPEFEHCAGRGSVYFFWDNKSKHLGRNYSFARGNTLELSEQRIAELTEPGAFSHAFDIFQKQGRSNLEDAITRAVYWYGDAHRDTLRVMQFIKYWSCLEGLLGGPGDKLTETLALGVVSVLSFGHFRLLTEPQWDESVKTVKRLYALRSSAIHCASHSHVTASDLVVLSTWTAWVIYNAVSFSHAGMHDTKTLWKQVQSVSKKRIADGGCASAEESAV